MPYYLGTSTAYGGTQTATGSSSTTNYINFANATSGTATWPLAGIGGGGLCVSNINSAQYVPPNYPGRQLGPPLPPREFNRFINGSDLLEEFMKRVGQDGVSQSEFMDLPVELFIKWLILRAAQQDKEDHREHEEAYKKAVFDHTRATVMPALPPPTPRGLVKRCLGTGRWVPLSRPVPYANKAAMIAHADKVFA